MQTVAAALAIHPFMLSKWRKDAREGRLTGRSPPQAVGDAADARARPTPAARARVRAPPGGARPPKKSHPVLFRSKRETSSRSSRASSSARPAAKRERAVSALRRVARGLLRAGGGAARARTRSRTGACGGDHAALRRAPRTLREPATAPPPPGQRVEGEPAARRPADARRPGCARRRCGATGRRRGSVASMRSTRIGCWSTDGRAAQSGLGRRHHVPARRGGLALSRRGDGPVLAARARLDAHAAAHGAPSTCGVLTRAARRAATARRDLPQRSRLGVHGGAVLHPRGAARLRPERECARARRQRAHGVVLPLAQGGAHARRRLHRRAAAPHARSTSTCTTTTRRGSTRASAIARRLPSNSRRRKTISVYESGARSRRDVQKAAIAVRLLQAHERRASARL